MLAALALKLIISAFPENAAIPQKFTCNGQNVSPAIEWSGAPPQTKSFALIVDDPDAPGGLFNHWLLWNIPDTVHSLDENFKPAMNVAAGTNDFGKRGYAGPCPPSGTHRYFFRLYALDVATLPIKPGVKRAELDRAIHGHIVEKSEYMGKYAAR
jgi:Raf kinase inhibitor-like YbhB/YbcL family protein